MTRLEVVERLEVLYGEIAMIRERAGRATKLGLPKLVAYLSDLRNKKQFALIEDKRKHSCTLWGSSKNPCSEILL